MGGQASRTRKLTLDNEDPTSVIKVSDEVVKRLKGNDEVRRRNEAANHPVAGSLPPGVPLGFPPPFHYCEPSLTSLQIRQEALAKMKKNDEYWERRITDLEKNHDKMKVIMEEEFKKAMDEIMGKKSATKPCVPCIPNRKKVMACYKKYPNQPMKCAKEVQAFAACVDMNRAEMVENKG